MADIAPALTWIQVIDSAIKIGLGALISGAATYWATKTSHSRDLEKHSILRIKELIEKISQEFEIFWDAYRNYYMVSLGNIAKNQVNEEPSNPSKIVENIFAIREFKGASETVREKIKNLSTVQALLLLLDDEASNEIIERLALETEKYMFETEKYMKDTTNFDRLDILFLKKCHNELLDLRKSFYKNISSIFKRPN